MNREQWLSEVAAKLLVPIQEMSGRLTPKFRISVGFPSRGALSQKKRVIGQCWDGYVSTSGHAELFISPVLADKLEVIATIAHELVHANVGCDVGHRGPFAKVARAIGLEGKMTATVPGERFKQLVAPIISDFGNYPHEALVANKHRKAQPTRLLKAYCPKCGYIVRVTQKWIDECGAPICPVHGKAFKVDG